MVDAFGKEHAEPVKPLSVLPFSREQEANLVDSLTCMAEWNARLSETIILQADQIVALAKENRELRAVK